MRSLTLALLFSAACGSAEPPPPWDWVEVDLQVLPAFDPKLADGSLDITVVLPDDLPSDCLFTVTATHEQGLSVSLGELDPVSATLTWDGHAADGLPLDPGQVQIAADLDCSERLQGFGEARVHIVRLGAAGIDLRTSDPDDLVPLAYHRYDLLTRGINTVPTDIWEWRSEGSKKQLADLDLDDGSPRPPPEPWNVPHSPPWGTGDPAEVHAMNLPMAAVAGSPLEVSFRPGRRAVSNRSRIAVSATGASSADAPAVRVVADTLEPLGEASWNSGDEASFSGLTAPDTLGLHTIALTWRFQARVGEDWVDMPGELRTEHPLWVTAGPTAVLDGSAWGASASTTWVGVLHDLQPAVQGLPADDHGAILDALRAHLHHDPWITYNPSDSAYSSFEGRYIYWDRIWFDMSDWLDRQDGIDLYCHSVACLLSSQANHLGIEAEYLTIVHADHPDRGRRFRTFLTRAAGTEGWRAWTFNSHGITRYDGLVWDAAVDIDGDESPAEAPSAAVQPMGLSFAAYAELLTADNMIIVNEGRCANF